MLSKVLADENLSWPLVRLLRSKGLDIVWIPETSYQGISDRGVISLANRNERVVLTRDSNFLRPNLRRKAKNGIIYIDKPVRGNDIEKLARNIAKALEMMKEKPLLVIVTSSTIELYPLTL